MAYYQVVSDEPFFRGIESEDLERVKALEAAGYPADEAASPEGIEYRAKSAPGCFIVAIKPGDGGDEIVGFVNGTLATGDTLKHETMSQHDPDGELLCIHSVCVDENHRRTKVGSRMLKAYVNYVQQSTPQAKRLILICKETLIGFYDGCGFEMVGPSDVVHGREDWFEMKIDLGALI
mmetsp:Transcript_30623/g.51580  ORF Transcript_30623/g.51580 Transcript_30623/m.51580 type:complete len:178 (+) Transcript_30623:101-634(+)|eukprot:CAMPEP_0198198094 /NCGR_PEP_ID=MMETSP1445-20131203/1592_1 /TAXON_ID=36898 /ORGANISM="Pyramimonas sp., Strain CCMP2087" /LENGTH=177 /DNA_ID=CAMNT_0043867551 /DNA_START=99 /DNA_END=632 /DNA_ORIENTATION=+